jgi:hypothetical protein
MTRVSKKFFSFLRSISLADPTEGIVHLSKGGRDAELGAAAISSSGSNVCLPKATTTASFLDGQDR